MTLFGNELYFGLAAAILLWRSWHCRNTSAIWTSGVILVGWIVGDVGQIITNNYTPLEVFFAADLISAAILFTYLFGLKGGWKVNRWVWLVATIYAPMISSHLAVHKGFITDTQHWWILMILFVSQILTVFIGGQLYARTERRANDNHVDRARPGGVVGRNDTKEAR